MPNMLMCRYKYYKATLSLLNGLLLMVLVLSGCGGHRHPDRKIFHYNEQSGIASLDPAFAKSQAIMWAMHQLYNTLVEVDSTMQLTPSLARRWQISEDRKTFTFTLRDDVYFMDDPCFPGGKGRKLVAADVVYSLQRIMDKSVASPGAWIFNGRVDSVNGFAAPDDTTFSLRLAQPFQPMLGILSMPYCSIVAREAVSRYGSDFRRHPVGTGPFRLVAWEEGQAMILARNERYFERDAAGRALPYLDGIRISFFDSKATEFLEFRQKRLDFINDIEASFKDEILTKTGNLKKQWVGQLLLHKHPYLNIEYIGILTDEKNPLVAQSPLRLRAIRQAINCGFDRRKMMLYLRNSIGTPAESGFVPMGLPSFDSNSVKGYRYDPERARRLLQEAGFPQGQGLPVIKLLTIPVYADLGSYIANELRQVGINIQVEAMQKSLLMEQTSKSVAPMFRGSWIADYPDAENYLSVFYSKNPAPPNYTRYKNPAFDALYEQALLTTNDAARYRLYQQMDRMVMEDAPVIPLWYDMVVHLVQPHVRNFTPNSLNLLELRRVDMAEK
jgi:ABC-type transport system substrate-binding protein